MEDNMDNENEFTDLLGYINEIRSSLIILQSAAQNDNEYITLKDVDNQLEIVNNLMTDICSRLLVLSTKLF